MRYRLMILVAILMPVTPHPAGGDIISLVPVDGYPTGANANALAGPLFSSSMDSVDISGPGAGFAMASSLGNTATHDFSVELDFSTGPAFFDSSYFGPFSRTSTLDHRASAESIFHFSVDVPTAYSVMGFFSAVDELGTLTPGNVELEFELLEFETFAPMGPPPTHLFYSYQVSHSTMDESFVAGGMGGDFENVLIGSPTGLMTPGKFYRYRTLVTINAIDSDGSGPVPPTDGSASASGAHVLLFSKAVPEPSGVLISGLAATVFVWLRRRRPVPRIWPML